MEKSTYFSLVNQGGLATAHDPKLSHTGGQEGPDKGGRAF